MVNDNKYVDTFLKFVSLVLSHCIYVVYCNLSHLSSSSALPLSLFLSLPLQPEASTFDSRATSHLPRSPLRCPDLGSLRPRRGPRTLQCRHSPSSETSVSRLKGFIHASRRPPRRPSSRPKLGDGHGRRCRSGRTSLRCARGSFRPASGLVRGMAAKSPSDVVASASNPRGVKCLTSVYKSDGHAWWAAAEWRAVG